MKAFIIVGAINALLAVALGAFGSHGLEGKVTEKYLAIWKTAVQYQMFHSIGILIIAMLSSKLPYSGLLNWSGWLMFSGIVFFSGSLYVLTLTQISVLGAITPIGGVLFITSWVLLILTAIRDL